MALGGGTFLFHNKKLPGTYINLISKDRAMLDIADRGYGTMALTMDWGTDGIFRVDASEFQKNCEKYFGYAYDHEKLKGLRDLFKNLKTGYFYRLNNEGVKASNEYATAKYKGIRGNDLSISIQSDVDNSGEYIVNTFIKDDDTVRLIDRQKGIKKASDLKDNDFVVFNKDLTLKTAVNQPLENGTNGRDVQVVDYQEYIELIEPYYFNVLGYAGADSKCQDLLIAFTKRMRDEVGAKFQLVIHGKENVNHEGVISILNNVKDKGAEVGSLAYWLTGAEASCPTNASLTNRIYDGEFEVDTKLAQYELEKAINDGRIAFHNVTDSVSGNIVGDVRLLTDINTFTEFTKQKNKTFSKNQVIRVLDNWAIDGSRIFNKFYLGKVQNDKDGRISLWKDFVALGEEYQRVRNIQNFNEKDIPIPTQGLEKDEVIWTFAIEPVCAMEKLYMTVVVV